MWIPEAGQMLAHYRLGEKIGRGGMGVVYKALDTRLHRNVAIKTLPPEVTADPARRARFLREARTAAAVTHPHIATIHEVGEADGVIFIVMELVEGETLRSLIGGRSLPVQEAIRIAVEIAEGLARAHRARIIHRDLKPDNIIVGSDRHAKILDFGLAKLLEDQAPPAPHELSHVDTLTGRLTAEGRIVGTAAYMSPEQARGQAVDSRTDVFSFGSMLYEMVTGRAPFQHGTHTDTLSAILRDTPAPAGSLNPSVPPELERIIGRCLEKEPGRRYPSAGELRSDLERLQASAPPAPIRRRPGLPRRWVLGAAGATTVILALFLVLAGGGWGRAFRGGGPPKIESLAVLPLQNLSGDSEQEYFADGMTDALITDLAKIGALRVISRTSSMRFKGTGTALPDVARQLNVDAVVEGSVMRLGGRVRVSAKLIHAATDRHLWAESYERDLRDLMALQGEVARAIAHGIRTTLTPQEAARLGRVSPVDPAAQDAYFRGRHYWNKRTAEGINKGLVYFQQAIDADPAYAPAYVGMADSYSMLAIWGALPEREGYPRARAAAAKALEIDDTSAEAHAALGRVAFDFDWDWRAAEAEFRRAIELNPSYATAHQWFAVLLAHVGRVDEAWEEVHRALDLDPLSLIINADLGVISYFRREHDTAIRLCRKALEMDPGFPPAHLYLGLAFMEKGMCEEAIGEFQEAAAKAGGAARMQAWLGWAHAVCADGAQARKVLHEVQDSAARTSVLAAEVALIYTGLGERDRAIEWLERAYQERSRLMAGLKMVPAWDSLRPDPRFQELLRRVGF